MLGHVLRAVLLLLLAGLLLRWLLNREQKRRIHRSVWWIARVFLAVAALLLAWRLVQYGWLAG